MNPETLELCLTQAQNGYNLRIKSERIEICADFTGTSTRVTCPPCETLEEVRVVIRSLTLLATLGDTLNQNSTLANPIPQYSFQVLHQKGHTSSLIRKHNISHYVIGSPQAQARAAALELLLKLAIATTA